MDHLSSMDAAFLHFETPETPMHVGSLELLELPKGYKGDFYEDAKAYLKARLHLVPAFQRKLALMPFDLANPVWVDDDALDIDHHIRHVILPRPGSFEKLEQLVGRLHSPLMDRSRPLWELYIIEGLAGGQVALYNKMHHAGIDGQAGVALAKVLFSDVPNPPPPKPPRAQRRPARYQLGVAELAGAALRNAGKQTANILKSLPATARSMLDMLAPPSHEGGKRRLGNLGKLQRAPSTPLNVSISNQRAFAARSVPLAEIKAMSKATGTSVNDVVMAICAGALKRWLAEGGTQPDKPLIAAVPVSLREPGNTDANNQVSTMVVSLCTDIDDRVQRLMAIHASAQQGKKQIGNIRALPTDFPSLGAPWMLSGLAALVGRSKLVERLPPLINVLISNVPGPQFPLYFAGAKLLTYYPVSIPAHGGALNMTVQSYNGSLEFGLTACRRAVPDIADLAELVVDEHHKLLQQIGARSAPAEAAAAPAPRAKPRAATVKAAQPAKPAAAAKARAGKAATA
jgi:diacylglycerol O-acyltransferase / wax synthase